MNYANELLNYMNLLDCNTNDICKETSFVIILYPYVKTKTQMKLWLIF